MVVPATSTKTPKSCKLNTDGRSNTGKKVMKALKMQLLPNISTIANLLCFQVKFQNYF